MSDISQQQMDDLLSTAKSLSGSMGKLADKFGASASGKANATSKLSSDLSKSRAEDTKSYQDHFTAVKRATKSTDALTDHFSDLAKGFAGMWVVGEIVKYGKENVDTYRDLSKVGQTFGGSMIEMSRQAAEAGLPLKAFADVIKKNNVVVGQVGTEAFFKLNKQLRDSIEQQGLYGYSLEELGDLQAVYMEQQRLAGKNMKQLTGPENLKSIQSFAANLVDVTDALSANREEVMKNYQDATKSGSFAATQRIEAAQGMDQYNKAMQNAIISLSAQPGVAGQMLSKGLSDAFATPGGAVFTDLGKQLISVGQGAAAGLMDSANARIASGEDQSKVVMETVKGLHDQLNDPAALQSLRLIKQAGGPNAAAAEQILELATNLKTYTAADLAAKAKDRKTMDLFTAFFSSFENVFEGLKGSFIDGFLTPFMKGVGQLDDKGTVAAFWDNIRALQPELKDFGTQLGMFVKNFFTPDNIQRLEKGLVEFIKVTGDVIKFGTWLAGTLAKTFEVVHKHLGDLGTAIAGLVLFFGLKGLPSLIKAFFLRSLLSPKLMMVKAGIVNVDGGGLGGGGGSAANGLGGDAAKAEKEAGAIAKGAKGAEEAEEIAMKAGKVGKMAGFLGKFGKVGAAITGIVTLGGLGEKLMSGGGRILERGLGKLGIEGGAKLLGRVGGTLVPGVGAAIDGVSAANSFKEGNNVAGGLYSAGAALNGAGAVTAATGIGLVATPFLDAAGFIASALGMAADFTGFGQSKGKKKINPPNPANPNAANPAGTTANPSATPPTVQPTVIDDESLAQLRTNAILGDQKSIDELKKIKEGMEKQTMVLYSVQRKTLEEQRKASASLAAQGGY